MNVYLANSCGRLSADVVTGSNDCSIGCTTLTSLPLGFIVPITPRSNRTMNVADVA